jgi:hypothetical protein
MLRKYPKNLNITHMYILQKNESLDLQGGNKKI